MKALILAAGRGSRMERYTDDRPKGLIQLDGCSLVERMIYALREARIDDIGIVTGYKKESYDFLDLLSFHNENWATTNMISSLSCAKEWLEQGRVMVCYSDIFVSPTIIKTLKNAPDAALNMTYDTDWLSLWTARNEDVLDDAESFRLSGGRITEIGNKANSVEEIEGQYMGLFTLTPESWREIEKLLAELPDEKAANISVTEVFQHLIERNFPIHGVPVAGEWGECDLEVDLLLYEKYATENHYGDWFYAASRQKIENSA